MTMLRFIFLFWYILCIVLRTFDDLYVVDLCLRETQIESHNNKLTLIDTAWLFHTRIYNIFYFIFYFKN